MSKNNVESLLRMTRFASLFNDQQNCWSRLCYHFYTFFSVFFGGFILLLLQSIYIIIQSNDLESFVAAGYLSFSGWTSVTTLFIYLLQWKRVQSLMLEMNEYDFEKPDCRQAQLLNSFRHTAKAILNSLVIAYLLMWLAAVGSPLLESEKRLPYVGWYPFDWTRRGYYELAYLHQTVAVFCGANIGSVLHTFIYTILAFIGLRCDILLVRISEEMPESAGDKDWEERLKEIIIEYTDIVRFAVKAEKYVGPVAFIQLVTCLINVAMTLFYINILLVTSGLNGEILAVVSFQIALLTELFFLCWFGNQIIIKSLNIFKQLYAINWVPRSKLYKKNLLILLIRTEKPLKITALNFADLSLETFKAVGKTTLSYFAVLNTVYEPK